jgi:peptide/nickel transport system permease protein
MDSKFLPPGTTHILGTDEMGRDIFSRIIYGSRISLLVSVVVVLVSSGIGVPLGLIAAYYGRRLGEVIMRVTDLFLSLPSIILTMAFAAAMANKSIYTVMIAVSITWWPVYTRLMYGQTLSAKEKQFVEAAKAAGASSARIITRHLFPECLTSLIVQASLDMGYTILTAAALGFIGIGAQPPTPEWGVMISTGRAYILDSWWISAFPGLAIFITVLAFNLLGDGVRDILDPHLRR